VSLQFRGAVAAAGELLDLAKADAAALVDRQDTKERELLLHSLGIGPGGAVRGDARACEVLGRRSKASRHPKPSRRGGSGSR